jgi:hypothetical protein
MTNRRSFVRVSAGVLLTLAVDFAGAAGRPYRIGFLAPDAGHAR